MAEKHVLAVPIVPPALAEFEVTKIFLDRLSPLVQFEVRSNTGQVITKEYIGQTALTMILQLNKAPLNVKSLERRVLERLLADGVLAAGAVTGTPD